MVTRRGIDFFTLSRSQWTKLSFAAHGVAGFVAPLNLSANSWCFSRLDVKATRAAVPCYFPAGGLVSLLRKRTQLLWKPQGTGEPVLSDAFPEHNTPVPPQHRGVAVGRGAGLG